ncbi:DUF2975 domain-containing protein [Cloacibacterium normanense]|uniref:DUF2975 domain-containing protein n=1 Tax=Cloacibacterium normanense TaxID=237258 RepID=A0A2S7I2P2_9FLAO|nr:DUF2975 domain-containing protein [Cloacibacterium normanense]PPZ90862.1 DUF2975 domain-containing protein [Cloacibacterium normanense]
MKLIGKNSVSKYFSYFFLVLFLFIAFHFIYEIIGFSVLYYKYKTGSNILSDYFLLGNDVGWAKNEYTNPIKDVLKFKIYYPFTEQNLLTGIYIKNFIINSLIGSGFFTLFSFICYKITNSLSKDYIFNLKTINLFKKLAWLSILFVPIQIINWFYNLNLKMSADLLYTNFIFLSLGIIIFFIIAFFKKGYELQSENDLTI